MLLVKCPGCKKNMKYQPTPGSITTKSKRCVFCGRTFKVHSSLPKSRIVQQL